jgi:SAM-dependent methyltransferase
MLRSRELARNTPSPAGAPETHRRPGTAPAGIPAPRGDSDAVAAARQFIEILTELDRNARRAHRTLPTEGERQELHVAFWDLLIPWLARVDDQDAGTGSILARREVQTVLNPWLLRSRFWARSYLKPHGYPGDYRMLEWMYDLESDPCADPHQPAAVNLLDGLYKSVHSVQAVWHRRRWFAHVIEEQVRATGHPVEVLDVACGGTRYVRDVIDRHGANAVRGAFFDQDASALSFIRAQLPREALCAATFVCAPVSRLEELLPAPVDGDPGRFDVVISTGLFDYLPQGVARHLLEHLTSLVRPGGTVAICNFSPEDRSKVVKDWIADWPLIYRTAAALTELFAPGRRPEISRSPDGGLLYARSTMGSI